MSISKTSGHLIGVVKEGSFQQDTFGTCSFLLTISDGTEQKDLFVQDHCAMAKGLEGESVLVDARYVEGVHVANSVEIYKPGKAEAVVSFRTTMRKYGDKKVVSFELEGRTQSTAADFRRFVRAAEAFLGIKVVDKDTVIQEVGQD